MTLAVESGQEHSGISESGEIDKIKLLEYIGAIADSLAKLCDRAGFKFMAFLLRLVVEQAVQSVSHSRLPGQEGAETTNNV